MNLFPAIRRGFQVGDIFQYFPTDSYINHHLVPKLDLFLIVSIDDMGVCDCLFLKENRIIKINQKQTGQTAVYEGNAKIFSLGKK